jgi:hypothetical protein
MNIRISPEKLIQLISKEGMASIEYRQVARRLMKLMPLRLQQLKSSLGSSENSAAQNERLALVSQDMAALIQEYIDTAAEARRSRVSYETHMMLLEARKSLRRLAKLGGHRNS